jgi:hypothetical protein
VVRKLGLTPQALRFHRFAVGKAGPRSRVMVDFLAQQKEAAQTSFTDNHGTHGFLDVGGMFTTLDVPRASSNSAKGLNTNGGQIVGTFTDGETQFGFVTVPEPSTLVLAGIGGVYLVVVRSMQRRR